MPPRRPAATLVLVAALALFSLLGCGSGGSTGFVGSVGGHDPDSGITLSGSDAGVSGGLGAFIEQGQVHVTSVMLSCSSGCATVEAVGTGGNPPYTFSWDDRSTAPTRTVCPTSTTSYSVEVTDTAGGGELGRPAETALAKVTVEVLPCPDGGAAEGGTSDGGEAERGAPDGGAPDGSHGLCIGNPSFEGAAESPGIDAPPWTNCTMTGVDTAIIDPTGSAMAQTYPAATDGSTYLELSATYTFGNGISGIVYQPLCAPIRAGTSYSLEIDLAEADTLGLTPTSLQIFGGGSACDMEQVLWTSPLVDTSWSTYCATLTPTNDWSFITLELTASTSATLFIDNIVPVASCP